MNKVGYNATGSQHVDLDDLPDLARDVMNADVMMQMARVARDMTREIDAGRKK